MRYSNPHHAAGVYLVAWLLLLSAVLAVTGGGAPLNADGTAPPHPSDHLSAAVMQPTTWPSTMYRHLQSSMPSLASRVLTGAPATTHEAAAVTGSTNTSSSSPQQQQQQPHKTLLPFQSTDAAVVAVAAFILFVAAGAGMGGGPVLVPVYLLLGQFKQSVAVALSNVTILAGSTANVACNARKRHPVRDRPMTDWDLILIMEPATVLGAVAGSYLNRVVPVWITHLLLAVLLVLMTVRVVQRAVTLYKRENMLLAAMAPQAPAATAAAAAEQVGATAAGGAEPGPRQPQDGPVSAAAPAIDWGSSTRLPPLHIAASPSSPGGHSHTRMSGSPLCTEAHLSFPYSRPVSPFAQPATAAAGGGGVGAAGMTAAAGSAAGTGRMPAANEAVPAGAGAAAGAGDSPSQLLPITSSECRLAYFPPDGVRQHHPAAEWEAAWQHNLEEEEDQEAAAAAAEADDTASVDNPAAVELSPAGLAPGSSADPPAAGVTAAMGPPLMQGPVGSATGGAQASHQVQHQQQQQANMPIGDSMVDGNHPSSDHHNSSSSGGGGSGGSKRPSLRSRLPQLLRGGQQQQQQGRTRRRSAAPEVVAMEQATALSQLLTQEAKTVPLFHLCWLTLLSASVLVTSVLSKRFPCGSWKFWVTQVSLVPVLGLVWGVARHHLLTKRKVKWRAGMDCSGDVQWNGRNTIVFPAICTLAGLMAGMFGLGGAVVKTPLMLELGVHPQVTAATTHTMLLFTTSAATIVYAQMGLIPWDYAGLLAAVALVMTLAGQLCIDRLVRAVGRASLVVVLLSGFFCVACALTIYIAATGVVGVVRHPERLTAGGSIC